MTAWATSTEGRLICAAVLFAVLWLVKSVPWVHTHLLTTRMRRRLAAGLLACAPAVVLFASGASLQEVVATALSLFVGATGFNALLPEGLKGEPDAARMPSESDDEWPDDPPAAVAASSVPDSEPGCEPDDEVD